MQMLFLGLFKLYVFMKLAEPGAPAGCERGLAGGCVLYSLRDKTTVIAGRFLPKQPLVFKGLLR
jgi:hypothetical protein